MTVIITITCDYQRAIGRSENIQSRGPVGRRSDPGNARVQPEEGTLIKKSLTWKLTI